MIERDIHIFYSTTLSDNNIKVVRSKVCNKLPPILLINYEQGFYGKGYYQSLTNEKPVDDNESTLKCKTVSDSNENEKVGFANKGKYLFKI